MTNSAPASSIFPSRRTPHTIILARGDKVRHWTVRPWVLFAAAGGLASLVAACVASTALFLMSDDIASAFRAREARTVSAYEERVAHLRGQLDTLASRQHSERETLAAKVDRLILRQDIIAARYSALEPVLEDAREVGLVPASVALPTARPEARHLAYAPENEAVDSIFGSFDLKADGSGHPVEALESDVLPLLRRTIEGVEEQQASQLGELLEAAEGRVARIGRVLGALGLGKPAEEPGMGGPYIPAPGETFADDLDRLSATLGQLRHLRSLAETTPVAAPIEGGVRSSGFGVRRDPFLNRRALHAGVDFAVASGTPVHAAAAGTVTRAGRAGAYGILVEIDHGNGHTTRYAHLSSIDVAVGDDVRPGQMLARSGSTGRSTGPHLHYEVRVEGEAVNPSPYLKAGRSLAGVL
ncbi:M23 family metallopeptidase [Aureimonas populi]|uniref:M23 family metallopeptidase n=1 Tax=Aureimonas populi TaxID=1701758 RepID=A0ABW5CP09_9HYPH|nr:M23 family metallopeptidase [Aureimonas populi]